MDAIHYVRPLDSHAQKRAVDAVALQHRMETMRWGFEQCAYLTHSTFGGPSVGYVEIVTLIADSLDRRLEAQALALVEVHDREVPRAGDALPTLGVVELFRAAPAAGRHADAPAAGFQRARSWSDVPPFTPAPAPPQPDAAPRLSPVPPHALALVGRAWPAAALTVDELVAWKLLERAMGADEHHAVLRTLREEGRIYSALTRHVYELGLFGCGTIAPYDPGLEAEVHRLLEGYTPHPEHLDQARRTLWFDLRVQRNHPFHALAPYALIDRHVTFERLQAIIDGVRIGDLRRILTTRSAAVRTKLVA